MPTCFAHSLLCPQLLWVRALCSWRLSRSFSIIMGLVVSDGENFLYMIIQVLPSQPCDCCPLLVLYPLSFRNSEIAHLSSLRTPTLMHRVARSGFCLGLGSQVSWASNQPTLYSLFRKCRWSDRNMYNLQQGELLFSHLM